MENRNPDNRPSMFDDAKTEISGMAKGGMGHPSTKPVIAGAVIGGLAGALLPVLTLPVGVVAGAGYALYNRIKR